MTLRFVHAPDAERERVDKLLARLMAGTSRSTIQRWIEEGRVSLDGGPCRAKDLVRPGAVLSVEPGPAPLSEARPDASIELAVVYEDEHLLVVDKPPGLVVHPARGHAQGTLVNGLLARPGFEASFDGADPLAKLRPGIVHRIDKDTSGLLVVAKNELTRERLKAQLAKHTVNRLYVALTDGVPREGEIRTSYGRDPVSRLKWSSRVDAGKLAVTHVRVRERFCDRLAALVECRLETGRTHQIRVHLRQQTGTPLLGDRLYGKTPKDERLAAVAGALGRQALHARVLGFRHPVSGADLLFEAEPPADFAAALAALRSLTA
jgi:23S rRNA pseudouridine1911/1915/1917 synthase